MTTREHRLELLESANTAIIVEAVAVLVIMVGALVVLT